MDVYAILGADRSASWADLQRRYRARARELHPDAQSTRPRGERLAPARATALFAELRAAWALVSTPERRRTYDQRQRPAPIGPGRRPTAPVPVARPRPRPEPWPTPYPVGVVRQTAPGGLHIIGPGSWADLSLPAWVERHGQGADALLVGDIPAQPALRQLLQHTRFVERIRLATMVCGVEPPPAADEEGHDDGRWKVEQVRTALQRWVRACPGQRGAVPYAADLFLMAQLSLRGYQLSLPHPAGLWGAVEPPPHTPAERAGRRAAPLLELEVPAAALLVAVAWARDQESQAALGQGWSAFLGARGLPAAAAAAIDRSLGRPRPRTDGLAPVPAGGLHWGAPTPTMGQLLRTMPTTLGYLRSGPPAGTLLLPWGAPLSLGGRDRDLGDAGTRLASAVLAAVLDRAEGLGLRLAWRRGPRFALRAAQPGTALEPLAGGVADAATTALSAALGYRVPMGAGLS